MKKNTLKWRRANIIYPSDHIISSKARENGLTAFRAPFEDEKQVKMGFIMSNEYMRLWYKEKGEYEKEKYSERETKLSESQHIKRRHVQRVLSRPKIEVRELPIIQLKRFQNILAKVDNRTEKKLCPRYIPTFQRAPVARYKPDCRPHMNTPAPREA